MSGLIDISCTHTLLEACQGCGPDKEHSERKNIYDSRERGEFETMLYSRPSLEYENKGVVV